MKKYNIIINTKTLSDFFNGILFIKPDIGALTTISIFIALNTTTTSPFLI